jgi:hypothetical protein
MKVCCWGVWDKQHQKQLDKGLDLSKEDKVHQFP